MSTTKSDRRKIGRIGALKGWANTVDRTERTHTARAASPSCVEWHIARLDQDKFADATPKQLRQAGEAAKAAYFADLAYKSAKVRRQAREDRRTVEAFLDVAAATK